MAFPLDTLAAAVTATGISAPPYSDVLLSLQASFRAIYGSDAYIEADSQDGQFLAVIAKAIDDCNQTAVSVYNAFSPATAQGAHLSTLVAINGMTRAVSSNSQATMLLGGTAGTVIVGGKVRDLSGRLWSLPPSVTITNLGTLTTTATCDELGAVAANVASLTQIATPTLGWQTATNTTAASLGAPVESDAALRRRQAAAVAQPSTTVLAGLQGALQSLPGVTRAQVIENDTNVATAEGLPPHSVTAIVLGGDANEIASTLLAKKSVGCYTNGTTLVSPVVDAAGIVYSIRYYVPTPVRIRVQVSITTMPNYSSDIGLQLRQAVVDFVNATVFGDDILYTRLYLPAMLFGTGSYQKYEVVGLAIAKESGALGMTDIAIAFNEQPNCVLADVTLLVV